MPSRCQPVLYMNVLVKCTAMIVKCTAMIVKITSLIGIRLSAPAAVQMLHVCTTPRVIAGIFFTILMLSLYNEEPA
jgi:hypothetical protein